MILVKQLDNAIYESSNINNDLNIYQNINDAYNYYLTLSDTKNIIKYQPQNIQELRDWIHEHQTQVLDVSWIDVSHMIDLSKCFYCCSQITEIKGIDEWNVSNIRNMNQMFYKCWSLHYLNISRWRPQHIQTMKEMFSGCKNLVRLNIHEWQLNPNKVNMEHMFDLCYASNIPNWYKTPKKQKLPLYPPFL